MSFANYKTPPQPFTDINPRYISSGQDNVWLFSNNKIPTANMFSHTNMARVNPVSGSSLSSWKMAGGERRRQSKLRKKTRRSKRSVRRSRLARRR